MKRRLLVLIAFIASLALCLAGCGLGSYSETDPVHFPPGGGSDVPVPEDGHYTATVYYRSAPLAASNGIKVVWENGKERIVVALDAYGRADAGKLDGDYTVRLVGLDKTYAYDPTAYVATADAPNVDIILSDVRTPRSGDGSAIYTQFGCYSVSALGFYRAVCKKGKVLYYEFKATESGTYSIQSCVDVREDAINPLMDVYGGTTANKWFIGTVDGGGAYLDGGYTKNFRWEVSISESEIGNVYTFGVRAESKTDIYPADVTFFIRYERPYKSIYEVETEVVRAKQSASAPIVAATPGYRYADISTKLYNGINFRYNPNTGLYHVYSPAAYPNGAEEGFGAGFGPYLCCELISDIPSYTTTTLFMADDVGDELNKVNMLEIGVYDRVENKYSRYSYVDFVKQDYASRCNGDGVCAVTPELKDFLQLYAVSHTLWTDGYSPVIGSPEDLEYSATQDDLWLFACGFYEPDDAKIATILNDRS